MRTIETTGVVTTDGVLTARLPANTPAGACKVTVTVEEPVPGSWITDGLIQFPGVLTDPTDTFRRETLYGDPDL